MRLSSLLCPAILALGLSLSSLPAAAGSGLPAPYVSRALAAVLIPIDGSVRQAFGLTAADKGLLVLAVSPGGVADKAGIAPGDIIAKAHGRAVTDPIVLDEVVYYWLKKGNADFAFDGLHGGKAVHYTPVITMETWSTVIEVATVATWVSYSYESFSYSEYTAEYSSEISESYSSSETTIEETTSTEEFASAETSEESATEETATEDASSADAQATDTQSEDAQSGDTNAEDPNTGDAPPDASADDGSGSDMGSGDTGGDSGGGDSDGGSDEVQQ